MKLEINQKKRNELLKRNEVTFMLDHEKSGTPSRIEVRMRLADMLSVDVERVYVRNLDTKTGSNVASGEANVYDSVEKAKYAEPEYIILRNTPKEAKEKQ